MAWSFVKKAPSVHEVVAEPITLAVEPYSLIRDLRHACGQVVMDALPDQPAIRRNPGESDLMLDEDLTVR
jgi:hypothetical protein